MRTQDETKRSMKVAKYEQVEYSKEKPKKSGWYRVSCVNGNPYSYTMRYYMSCAKSFADDGFGGAGTCDCLYWYRKLRKVRTTTGLTAVRALKAMRMGECVQVKSNLDILKIDNDDKILRWWCKNEWIEIASQINWFTRNTFSIVPDPSKVEPEREEVDFFAMVKGCFEGKKYRTADGMNTFSSKTPGILCMGDTPIEISFAWMKMKFYEVKE